MQATDLPWDIMFANIVNHLKIAPSEFWKLTFSEYYSLVNMASGKVDKSGRTLGAMTKEDVIKMEQDWANGNTRRISS